MKIIGLTGGIGSGKSTISEYLASKGYEIIDADLISREIVKPGQAALKEIASAFGEAYLLPDGTLDRKRLGSLVFSNPEDLKKLNGIMGMRIRENIFFKVKHAKSQIVVLDAAMLIESGLDKIVDAVWIVDAPDEERIKRVMKRDSMSEEQVKNRIQVQMKREERLASEYVVIDNSGSLEYTHQQIEYALQELLKSS